MPYFPADPTTSQLHSYLKHSGGRQSLILDATKAILKRNFPPWLANARSTLKNCALLPDIESYHVAGEKLGNKFPFLVVSASSQIHTEGMGGFSGQSNLVIAVLSDPVLDSSKALRLLDLTALARSLMRHYLEGYKDEYGRHCWGQMQPTGEAVIAHQAEQYTGFAAHFQVDQFRSENYWEATETP